MKKNLSGFPLHILFFSLYPVLSLYTFNIDQTPLGSILRAVVFSLVLIPVTVLFGFLLYRDWKAAAVSASVILLLVLTYGHLFNLVDGLIVQGVNLGRHRYFFPLWLAILIVVIILVGKNRSRLSGVTKILNFAGGALIVMTLVNMGWYWSGNLKTVSPDAVQAPADISPSTSDGTTSFPDVYYILMDAYSREDVLRDIYGLDLSDFLAQLNDLGFIIPECTQSNYAYTTLSLSSSLNMDYLDEIGIPVLSDPGSVHKLDFQKKIRTSAVRSIFEEMEYSTVTFKAIYPFLDITDSTYYYDYYKNASTLNSLESLNFHDLFLRTTVFRIPVEYLESHPAISGRLPIWFIDWISPGNAVQGRNYRQYKQSLYLLDVLEKIPELPGRKFVYAHLFITHQPFVFNPDGSFRTSGKQDNQAYKDQVVYANTRLIEIIKTILEKSHTPPIIIIQGDHAYPADPASRMKILNAYYLPNLVNDPIYPAITPVNSFRVVLNSYFGAHYPILPDISYYSSNGSLKLEEIPPSCSKQK